MKTGIVQDQNVEKQMGCMAGFLQIFDRHQILTGKRIYSTKRLPPSVAVNSTLEPEKLSESTEISRELEKQPPKSTPSPDRSKQHKPIDPMSALPETTTPSKTPLPLSVFEFKQGTRSSWKFSKEAPRLSLDSRAIVDAEGSLHPREIRTNRAILSTNRCENSGEEPECDSDKQRRSPSVIARLMGLEQLPSSEPESVKKVELRRSASESRASRDLFHYRFFDSNNFQLKQMQQEPHCQSNMIRGNAAAIENRICNGRPVDPKEFTIRNVKAEPAKAHQRGMGQKKSFYDSADFFPEAKQTVSIYGEIEKRLKMRGIDEPSKDLETLKQILEALQLKGLLHHSKKPISQTNMSNFVHDRRSYTLDESPIVVMKPARSPVLTNRTGMTGGDSHPSSFRSRPRARRNLNISNETLPTASPRRGQTEILDRNVRNQTRGRTASSPTRIESSVKSPNRRRATNIETQRKRNDSDDQRRISPVQSPKIGSRRIISEQQVTNRSPRMRKPTVEIYQTDEKVFVPAGDESSTISEISISTCSQTDTERSKVEDYKEGRNLLERCDKLLHSIAEITTTELQPSPVSVLDSSFYESSSPSPVMKRSIDYEDQTVESEDDIWTLAMSSIEAKYEEISADCDFVYVTEILRASKFLVEDSDVFLLLEKQRLLKGKDTSKASRLERRLIFDVIQEILNRNGQLPPWRAVSLGGNAVGQTSIIWSEFQRIRERDESSELLEVICGVLRKDLADDAIHGWGDCPMEMGDAILDIERLIFKDLIGETIRDLAAFGGSCNKVLALCRKLVF